MVDPVDPNSIPMLTDVMVPGRSAMGRPAETPAAVDVPSSAVSSEPASGPQAALDARDVEFIAERLRARFSTYLRRDARGVIEAHCRDAIEEHTNWLVRQVTRDVLGALEQEVAGWVRDAVSEELARHTSRR
ncbi:DUF2486 family protein [Trinickia sp.]|uniref:DUF2486 family protein n=1 Tax=Trinickia sp. TaxID=2571163 RepID=UPI003F80DD5F